MAVSRAEILVRMNKKVRLSTKDFQPEKTNGPRPELETNVPIFFSPRHMMHYIHSEGLATTIVHDRGEDAETQGE